MLKLVKLTHKKATGSFTNQWLLYILASYPRLQLQVTRHCNGKRAGTPTNCKMIFKEVVISKRAVHSFSCSAFFMCNELQNIILINNAPYVGCSCLRSISYSVVNCSLFKLIADCIVDIGDGALSCYRYSPRKVQVIVFY